MHPVRVTFRPEGRPVSDACPLVSHQAGLGPWADACATLRHEAVGRGGPRSRRPTLSRPGPGWSVHADGTEVPSAPVRPVLLWSQEVSFLPVPARIPACRSLPFPSARSVCSPRLASVGFAGPGSLRVLSIGRRCRRPSVSDTEVPSARGEGPCGRPQHPATRVGCQTVSAVRARSVQDAFTPCRSPGPFQGRASGRGRLRFPGSLTGVRVGSVPPFSKGSRTTRVRVHRSLPSCHPTTEAVFRHGGVRRCRGRLWAPSVAGRGRSRAVPDPPKRVGGRDPEGYRPRRPLRPLAWEFP